MINFRHLAAAAVLFVSSFTAFAQGEKSNWFFGKGAGIVFSGDSATASSSRMFTEEGSATLSDKDGNLLLYTNGITVWNKHHRVMPNGNGLMGKLGEAVMAARLERLFAGATPLVIGHP